MIEIARLAIASVLTLVLLLAAISDIRERRIPNWTVLAVIILFLPWAMTGSVGQALSGLAAFGIAAIVTFGMYLARIIGAGDCKIFSACALFAGMGLLPHLAAATALSGGLIAVLSLIRKPTEAVLIMQTRGAASTSRGVPYGVAISIGALLVVWPQALGRADFWNSFLGRF